MQSWNTPGDIMNLWRGLCMKSVFTSVWLRQEKHEIARNALRKNIAIEDIVEITGLTREEVESLRS